MHLRKCCYAGALIAALLAPGCSGDTESGAPPADPEFGVQRGELVSATKVQTNTRQRWSNWICAFNNERCLVGDFTGDGRDDVAAVRPDGQIWVARSNGRGFENVQRGTA